MDKNNTGSALIMVMILLSLMTILMLASVKGLLWTQQMQQSVIEKEQQRAFVQGAFECAIARATSDFDMITKNNVVVGAAFEYYPWVIQMNIVPGPGGLKVLCCLKSGTEILETQVVELAKNEYSKMHL